MGLQVRSHEPQQTSKQWKSSKCKTQCETWKIVGRGLHSLFLLLGTLTTTQAGLCNMGGQPEQTGSIAVEDIGQFMCGELVMGRRPSTRDCLDHTRRKSPEMERLVKGSKSNAGFFKPLNLRETSYRAETNWSAPVPSPKIPSLPNGYLK